MLKKTKLILTALLVSIGMSVAQANTVYTSDSSVTAWDPIFPSEAYSNWDTEVCKIVPEVGLSADWVNPHASYEFGTNAHPWQSGSSLNAQWINAWEDIVARGPGGHSWTRYTTEITGEGEFVLDLLADNCSWIYIDGNLVGFQAVTSQAQSYPVVLNGEHTLDFLIFDGGGLAGGMFRLETNSGTVFVDSDGDGLTDAEEVLYGTNPLLWDTDGDGFSDGEEVAAGTNPLDPNDFPAFDADGDGVFDGDDLCPDTASGAVVDQFGCSGVQNVASACACSGSSDDQPWKNHGQYVRCVVGARNQQVNFGLLTEEEGEALVSAAAQSQCGKPSKGKGKNK